MNNALTVMLVHGMGRSPLSFGAMARDLSRAGHRPERFGYVTAVQSIDAIVARLRRRLAAIAAAGRPWAAVGHSLGGVLLRLAIPGLTPAPRHLIFLATPNRPSSMARRVSRLFPYRLVTGEPGQRLGQPAFYATVPAPAVPYTIIAGTAGPRGGLSPFGEEPNDWIVAVKETLIRDDDQPLLLPVEHTFMPRDARLRQVVLEILARRDTPSLTTESSG